MSNDFSLYAGDDKTLVITVLDVNGDVVDITGATARWRASRSRNKTADIIKKTGGSGISLSDPTSGQMQVTLLAADTEDLLGSFFHECQVTFPGPSIATVLEGKMTVLPALIRSTAS